MGLKGNFVQRYGECLTRTSTIFIKRLWQFLKCLCYLILGPSSWADTDIWAACGDDSQSPINIVTSDAEEDDDLAEFNFDYGISNSATIDIVNNGHTGALEGRADHKSVELYNYRTRASWHLAIVSQTLPTILSQ